MILLAPLTAMSQPVAQVPVAEVYAFNDIMAAQSTYRIIPPYFKNMRLEEVAHISTLKDNWDGHNASRISSSAINNARVFIECVAESILEHCSIYPIPSGHIVIDIEKGEELVSIEFSENNIGLFTDFTKGDNVIIDDIPMGFHGIPKHAMDIVSQFMVL